MKRIVFSVFLLLMSVGLKVHAQNDQLENIAKNQAVLSSSETEKYPAVNAVDGKITRDSKWMPHRDAHPPHFLEINLQKYFYVNKVIVHTGIPKNERTPAETGQTPGFWAVKHFRLQYWDDANWTDIPATEITENWQTAATFHFSPAILAYKLRFVAFDAEPLNVMEIEVFGDEASGMVIPENLISPAIPEETEISASGKSRDITITVNPEKIGKSMQYIGYNQSYYLPGSNVSGWLEYSGVNSLRVWTSLNAYAPVSCVRNDSTVTRLSDFEARKSELRKNPENNRFIRWKELKEIYSGINFSVNSMAFDYVLSESKRLGIDILLQINERNFKDEWSQKWQQWQRFYALAYYAARNGNVSMFAMHNEPNHRHSGPMSVEEWLTGMRIVSDAVRCAVEDVNIQYRKKLAPKFVGPVTAGTNVDWWAKIIQNIRTDYRGEIIDYDLIDIFSTHSYNSPAAGYTTRVESIRKIIQDNHPEGKELPVVYTEIGRWMNAYLIDKEETMDSPSLFTEWAGIYTNNMLNGAYGMWAFKFASNVSSTYPRGIKSGHHFIWNGKRLVEDAWVNQAFGKPVRSSILTESLSPDNVVDGNIHDHSSYIFDANIKEKWLEIDLLKTETIGSVIIYTGSSYGVFTGPDRLRNYKFQYKSGNSWIDIPDASEINSKYVQILLQFENPVKARHIRLIAFDEELVKIREIKLFKYGEGPETAKESYDISGIHRTGEVVRLFAKGFKAQRELLDTDTSETDPGLDACSSFDPKSGKYYIWLVQRSPFSYRTTVNLSKLKIPAGHPIIAEAVGPSYFGEIAEFIETDQNSTFEITMPAQTVMLITIPSGKKLKKASLFSESAVTVSGNNVPEKTDKALKVSLDAQNKANNKVSYVHFDLTENQKNDNEHLSILGVNGYVDKGEVPMRIHVYGFPSEKWDEQNITWENAPYLDQDEALIQNVGKEVFLVGQLVFDQTEKYHYLDVTNHVQKYHGKIVFIFVRETRHMGDYADKGRNIVITSPNSEKPPMLISY